MRSPLSSAGFANFALFGSTRISTRTLTRLPRIFKYLAVSRSLVKLLKVLDQQEV